MVENTEKKAKHKFNVDVIKRLAEKHKVTDDFVRLSIRGLRTSDRAEMLKKEYKALVFEIKTVLNK